VTVASGICLSLGRYLRLLVRASFSLAQPLASCHFFSENPRLTLAEDLGRGKTLSVTVPSGFSVQNHSTRGHPVRPPRAWPIHRPLRCPRCPGGLGTTESRSWRWAPWPEGWRCAAWLRGRTFAPVPVRRRPSFLWPPGSLSGWLPVRACGSWLPQLTGLSRGPHTRRHRLPGPSPCGSCGPSTFGRSCRRRRIRLLRSPVGTRP